VDPEAVPARGDRESVLEANERPLELQLASLRLATYDPKPTPTGLGLLLGGEAPTRLLPHAYVQLVRFDGDDRAAPIVDQQRFDGPLDELDLRKLARPSLAGRVAQMLASEDEVVRREACWLARRWPAPSPAALVELERRLASSGPTSRRRNAGSGVAGRRGRNQPGRSPL